ncbi:MAG: DUF421 domain-containing protein [Clostridia bacterium]|nr:DUF421 domain-containing protein [Clostridia bacterium]
MLTILLRTVIIYIILIGTMRMMGKRQLGELEVSELVTTLLISEIAAAPIGDPSIPVIYAVIPLVTILTLEITLSIILLKCPRLKNIASARPSILIRHGKIDQKELRRIRISIDELISEIRQTGLSSFAEVDYAILEQNGKISVIPRKSAQPPSAANLGLHPKESGIVHALIEDGVINRYNLELLSLGEVWLRARLAERALAPNEVFFLGIDDSGSLYWIEEEDEK